MNPALLFLVRRSAYNALRTRLKRLKSPRYLVPTLLGAIYFIFLFTVGFDGNRHRGGPPEPGSDLMMEWGITFGFLILSTLSWVLPVRGAPLAFLEPEVAHLFPAPVTRRDLVRYKLLDYQRFFLFMPILVGLFNLRRTGVAGAAALALGLWAALMVSTLHGIGAKMTRLSLAENGWSGWKRSLVPILVVASYLGFIVWAAPHPPTIDFTRFTEDFRAWFVEFDRSLAAQALFPVRAVFRPFFAHGAVDYSMALAWEALLLVLLYLWVMRTDTAFEEASAAQAETLARRIEAAKKGRISTGETKPARKNPFPLASSGPPETAFVWKSVAELLRGVSPRLLLFALMAVLIAVPISLDMAKGQGELGQRILISVAVVMGFLGAILVFMGPTMVGVNLRQDLERADVLKTFPLSGGRLVRCSLIGTIVPIAILQAVLVLGAVLLAPDPPKVDFSPAWRLAVAVLGVVGLPAVTAISATVDAGLVLFFPGWVKPGQQAAQGGMEGMGYGMLTAVVKMASLGLGLLLPAAIGVGIAALGIALGGALWAPAFVMAGGLVGAALVAVELWLLSALLGTRFEAFDPSTEVATS